MPPGLDQRRATVGHVPALPSHPMHLQVSPLNSHLTRQQALPPNVQGKPHVMHAAPPSQAVHAHVGSMPYLPAPHHAAPMHANTLQHNVPGLWGRQRGSLQGFNVPSNMVSNEKRTNQEIYKGWRLSLKHYTELITSSSILSQGMQSEPWESPESISPSLPSSPWGRPLRRNASVLELGGGVACGGCAHCAPASWRYGSCASLEHGWPTAWPPPPACCAPHGPHLSHMHPHAHLHSPHTPQPYRRGRRTAFVLSIQKQSFNGLHNNIFHSLLGESRGVSRVASRTGSRAASPAMSVRSRTSRRTKHRTPSPPPLPSSDADSESESDSDRAAAPAPVPIRTPTREPGRTIPMPKPPIANVPPPTPTPSTTTEQAEVDGLAPVLPPSESNWQCEHCTFVNEPGVRVCVVCCRTPTTVPRVLPTATAVAAPVQPNAATDSIKGDPDSGLERLKLNSPSPVHIAIRNVYPKQS